MKQLKRKIAKTNLGYRFLLNYHRLRSLYLSKYSDKDFAQYAYQRSGLGILNIDNPKTFDEKLWWLKINYRDELMIECTDKIKVRNYVKSKGLDHILNTIYGVYENSQEIPWDKLPDKFYLKTNHSSGTNQYIKNKNQVNRTFIEKRMDLYLKRQHYPLSREWNYRDIAPKIFSEKVLDNNKKLVDYKFLCSYGKVNGLIIDTELADDEVHQNNVNGKRKVYDSDFNEMKITFGSKRNEDSTIQLPHNIKDMKQVAEVLSEPFPFCRVDLYNIGGDIIFGELTFFHTGGINKIHPEKYKKILGEWINLPL